METNPKEMKRWKETISLHGQAPPSPTMSMVGVSIAIAEPQPADPAAVRRGETILLVAHLTQTENAITEDIRVAGCARRTRWLELEPQQPSPRAATPTPQRLSPSPSSKPRLGEDAHHFHHHEEQPPSLQCPFFVVGSVWSFRIQ
ncbi:unnamed protein product [Lupinus luteus]|uniref:Uncharacterized protein n=1 Tax=Lupinus luteus TaxID=3873 RepID=A0AAV1WPR4_LUPLU